MESSFLRHRIVFFLTLLVLASRLVAADPWPAVDSDLPADERVVWGKLPNGLRYVILPNGEPKDHVSLRLLVAAGSLNEREEERGLAHFVEHMVFRGTKTHPNDSLGLSLERIGIGMGPDNTAFTSYNHTIYHLEASQTDEKVLRKCLQAFREYAEEVTFKPELIERERGVVLSEEATRAKPDFYLNLANLNFVWPNCRQVTRVPIGLSEIIKHCTREQLVGFYDAWYRPERMAVIVVGTVDVALAEKLVRETFETLAGRGAPRDEPPSEIPPKATAPGVQLYSEANQSGVTLIFEHPQPYPETPDTAAVRARTLHQALAFSMFQNRLAKYSRQFPGTFVAPSAWVDTSVRGWRRAMFLASGKILEWKRVTDDLEQEHRRAFVQGFTEDELAIAKSAFLNSYEESARTAASRPSEYLAGRLVECLLRGERFVHPEATFHDVAPLIQSATAKDCTMAFREVWEKTSPHVLFVTNPIFPFAEKEVVAELNESRKHETPDLLKPPALKFAYTDFGPAGKLVQDKVITDLDVRLARFANGVNLNFKQTDFVADWVEIRVRVGTGKISQPTFRPGLDALGGAAFIGGGLNKHTAQDLGDLLAGHSVHLGFHVENDAFVFTAQCAKRDVLMALQLITAYLTDAAYRPDALRDSRAQFASLYLSIAQSPTGPITQKARRILANGDRRFGVPEPDELVSCNLVQFQTWAEPHFKSGPIELSVVGDLDWSDAQSAVAQTLGALAERGPRTQPGAEAELHPPKPTSGAYIFNSTPGLKQVAVSWAWTVPDSKSTHEERRYRVMAAVLAEHLRVRLREQLGAVYSPYASYYDEQGFKGANYLMATAEILPAHFRKAVGLIGEELKLLREKKLSDDEFTRLKEPLLHALREERRTNSYWSATVLSDAQENPLRLEAARDREKDYGAISKTEVETLLKDTLAPAKTFLFIAVPPEYNR